MKTPNVFAKPSDLKPCPFCGGAAVNVSAGCAGPTNLWHAGDQIFAVNCGDCGASVPNRYRNNLVVDAWNTRVAPAQATQPAQVPAGYRLVPIEPTLEMRVAAEMSEPRGYTDLYRAMIAAAPEVKPKGLFIDMLAEHPGLAEELKATDELTDERILELAHRKATKYTHAVLVTGGPAFTFSKAHIVDFARTIEKEIRG